MASVSVERFFLFYLGVNFCLLYFTGRAANCCIRQSKLFLGASVLAAYLTGEYLYLDAGFMRLFARGFVSMGVLYFLFCGVRPWEFFKIFLFVNMLAMLAGGVIYNFSSRLFLWNAILGIFFTGILVLLAFLPLKRRSGQELCGVAIEYGGRHVALRGFLDSGNLLYTPLGLLPVVVADYRAALPLFSAAVQNFLRRVPSGEWLASLEKCSDEGFKKSLALVRSSSIGGERLLLAVRADRIAVTYQDGGQRAFCGAVALAESSFGFYDVLLHHDFIE